MLAASSHSFHVIPSQPLATDLGLLNLTPQVITNMCRSNLQYLAWWRLCPTCMISGGCCPSLNLVLSEGGSHRVILFELFQASGLLVRVESIACRAIFCISSLTINHSKSIWVRTFCHLHALGHPLPTSTPIQKFPFSLTTWTPDDPWTPKNVAFGSPKKFISITQQIPRIKPRNHLGIQKKTTTWVWPNSCIFKNHIPTLCLIP